MKCKECKYCQNKNNDNSPMFIKSMCEITHIINPVKCDYIQSDKDVENMDICFNCKHWIGMGDWGLSCKKVYENCNTNGFHFICKHFERKEVNESK